MTDWLVVGAFVGYLAVVLGIGFFFSHYQENLGDYYLGGRRMNKWVVALSAQASDMSGWLLMGLPGAVYLGGLSEAWIGVGLLVGTYLNWRIVSQRLRRYSQMCGDSITIPDFICNRFRDQTGVSRSVAATPLSITHVNLLDDTVEGVSCEKDRVFSVQYHPESAPGPQDSAYLFDRFIRMMEE